MAVGGGGLEHPLQALLRHRAGPPTPPSPAVSPAQYPAMFSSLKQARNVKAPASSQKLTRIDSHTHII